MLENAGAALLLCTLLAIGYFGTLLAAPGARGSFLLSSVAVLAHAFAVLAFTLLGLVGFFRYGAVLAVSIACATALGYAAVRTRGTAHAIDVLRQLRFDMQAWLKNRYVLVSCTLVAIPLCILILRGLVIPPLGWDALTYHLTRAAFWVKSGSLALPRAPDHWNGTYLYSPFGGDALWAWAMLPFHSDRFVALASLSIWPLCGLSTYHAARAFRAPAALAGLYAAVIMLVPTCVHTSTIAYVDNNNLAYIMFGAGFLAHAAASNASGSYLLAAVALALSAANKLSGAPFLALGAAITFLYASQHYLTTRDASRSLRPLLFYGAGALVAAPLYIRTWIETGSPVFPAAARLPFGIKLAGYDQFIRTQAGGPPVSETLSNLTWFFRTLFYDPVGDFVSGTQHVNLGLAAPLLLIAGPLGLLIVLRERPRLPTLFLIACIVLPIAALFSDKFAGQRGLFWLRVGGRLIMPAFGALAVLCSRLPERAARWLAFAMLALEVPYAIPRGWRFADVEAALTLLKESRGVVAFAALLLALGIFLRSSDRARTWLTRVAAATAAIGVLVHVPHVRRKYRYEIYHDAGRHPALYDFHILSGGVTGAWNVWQMLDTPGKLRIAASVAWEGAGDNSFRYNLFGEELQNDIVYVPITRDGRVVNYEQADALPGQADVAAWLRRMIDERIDYFVTLHPAPIERRWAEALPDVFPLAARATWGDVTAFKFNTEAARKTLRDRTLVVRPDGTLDGTH